MNFIIIISIILGLNTIVCNGVDVRTSSGLVRGQSIRVLNQRVDQFIGIPFAEPPIGDLRFAKPEPISTPLPGVIDATIAKNSCIQDPNLQFLLYGNDYMGGEIQLGEDCLFLNVWSQTSNNNGRGNGRYNRKLKPVMFWIHGGGFEWGSSFQQLYNGSVLATQDVVVVSTNYRLGYFGSLYANDSTAPGNVGLYDQRLALQWVRDNIHLFGGDKNQITIFGESAGSLSVSAHLLSPKSKGLFRRAIMESGAQMFNKNIPSVSTSTALLMAEALGQQFNCSDDNLLSCLRNVSADDLFAAVSQTLVDFPVIGTDFLPILAQQAFAENEFNKDLEIMAGINRDEATLIGPYLLPSIFNQAPTEELFVQLVTITDSLLPSYDINSTVDFYLSNVSPNDTEALKQTFFDFFGDILIKCPTYLFAKRYAENSLVNNKVFFYELNYAVNGTDANGLGIYHGAELPLVFGLPLIRDGFTDEDKQFSRTLIQYWTHFAKYGNPGQNWRPLIGNIERVKDLDPNEPNTYFNGLFDMTCNGIWSNYY